MNHEWSKLDVIGPWWSKASTGTQHSSDKFPSEENYKASKMSNSHVFNVRSALRKNTFARTPRKPNWSEVECEFLLQEIQKNISVIRSRKPDGCGSRKSHKADMWYKMCLGLHNKRPTVTRSMRDLKDKWKKLQFMAKQHITRVRTSATANRTPDGHIQIPKLVFRVMEARGQDPEKLGYCYVASNMNHVDSITMNQTVLCTNGTRNGIILIQFGIEWWKYQRGENKWTSGWTWLLDSDPECCLACSCVQPNRSRNVAFTDVHVCSKYKFNVGTSCVTGKGC